MNRNQKIALGCGGAGCLGLILLVVLVIVLSAAGYISLPGSGTNRNGNYNSNSNSNYNSSDNGNSNDNSSTSSSMSDDDRHKLFQAAAATKDAELTKRVWTKLGLLKTDGSPNDEYAQFMKDHIGWIFRNTDFIRSINTPQKARAYVDAHIDD